MAAVALARDGVAGVSSTVSLAGVSDGRREHTRRLCSGRRWRLLNVEPV
jgi:hypothetical protein